MILRVFNQWFWMLNYSWMAVSIFERHHSTVLGKDFFSQFTFSNSYLDFFFLFCLVFYIPFLFGLLDFLFYLYLSFWIWTFTSLLFTDFYFLPFNWFLTSIYLLILFSIQLLIFVYFWPTQYPCLHFHYSTQVLLANILLTS